MLNMSLLLLPSTLRGLRGLSLNSIRSLSSVPAFTHAPSAAFAVIPCTLYIIFLYQDSKLVSVLSEYLNKFYDDSKPHDNYIITLKPILLKIDKTPPTVTSEDKSILSFCIEELQALIVKLYADKYINNRWGYQTLQSINVINKNLKKSYDDALSSEASLLSKKDVVLTVTEIQDLITNACKFITHPNNIKVSFTGSVTTLSLLPWDFYLIPDKSPKRILNATRFEDTYLKSKLIKPEPSKPIITSAPLIAADAPAAAQPVIPNALNPPLKKTKTSPKNLNN